LSKPITIKSSEHTLNKNGIMIIMYGFKVMALPSCSHSPTCTNFRIQTKHILSVIIHHLVQDLVVVLIFILPTHQTPTIVVLLISVIVTKMTSTTLIIILNLINCFQVVHLISSARYSIKFTVWYCVDYLIQAP
jgi:hypothetical protein